MESHKKAKAVLKAVGNKEERHNNRSTLLGLIYISLLSLRLV
jgi:hypothetical protein